MADQTVCVTRIILEKDAKTAQIVIAIEIRYNAGWANGSVPNRRKSAENKLTAHSVPRSSSSSAKIVQTITVSMEEPA